jgi:hypothetical protein
MQAFFNGRLNKRLDRNPARDHPIPLKFFASKSKS